MIEPADAWMAEALTWVGLAGWGNPPRRIQPPVMRNTQASAAKPTGYPLTLDIPRVAIKQSIFTGRVVNP